MSCSNYVLKVLACAAGLAILIAAGPAAAQTSWTGGISAAWSNSANWDNGVPDNTMDATINCDSMMGVLYEPVLDANGSALNLYMGTSYDSSLTVSNNYTLEVIPVDSAGGVIYVGQSAYTTSTIHQTDGTVRVGELWLGGLAIGDSGEGIYQLDGGTLEITGRQIVVGEQGAGTFNQTGGTVNCPDAFYVGDNWYGHASSSYPGAGGTMTISGGVFNGGQYYGLIGTWGGNGELNVSGTGILNVGSLEMGLGYYGNTAGSNSQINLSGNGQINLLGHIILAANEATTGVLTQTGGTLTTTTLMKGPGTGTYNLTGGTLNVSTVPDMSLVNNGATLNVGGPGAVTTLVFGDPGGDPINLALNKPAEVSTPYDPNNPATFPASYAVDGIYSNFCHTGNFEDSWWRVDLTEGDSNVSMDQIVITARYDGFNQHFSNFYVRVIDKDDVTQFEQKYITTTEEYLDAGEQLAITLPSTVDARYVEVQIDGWNLVSTGYLFFTEMDVYDSGNLTPSDYTDYTQSSTSVLGIELDPANELCDQLVAGVLTIDGTLDVTALSSDFAAGQIFDILDWETLVGTFSTVNLPTLTGTLAWDDSALYTTGELAVISTGTPIPGDANNSGTVDEADALILANNWGVSGEEIEWGDGDFNDDNVVNAADAAILAANWGATNIPESAPVPEPSALLMLALGAVGLLTGARRTRNAN